MKTSYINKLKTEIPNSCQIDSPWLDTALLKMCGFIDSILD